MKAGIETEEQVYSSDRELERRMFQDRLRSLVPERGERSFARRAGISPGGLRGAMTNGNPGREMLTAIAREAGVSVEWLATGQGPRTTVASQVASEPGLYQHQQQGHRQDRIEGQQALSNSMIPPPSPTHPTVCDCNHLPLLAYCLEASQGLDVLKSTYEHLAMAMNMVDALNYISNGKVDPKAVSREDLRTLARIIYQIQLPQERQDQEDEVG